MSLVLPDKNNMFPVTRKNTQDTTPSLICVQKGLSCIVEEFITNYFLAHEGLCPSSGLYDRVIQEVERPLLSATLRSVKGNQKKAAEILGMNRNTLRKKLADLNLDPQLFQSPYQSHSEN